MVMLRDSTFNKTKQAVIARKKLFFFKKKNNNGGVGRGKVQKRGIKSNFKIAII